MSNVPPDYIKATSFTTLATQPITISGLPGSQLDSEFTNVSETVNQTIDRLSLVQKDDGSLRSKVVTIDSLSPETAAAISTAGARIAGEWAVGAKYLPGDVIIYGADNYAYICAVTHTASANFESDFSAKAWAILGYRPPTNDLVVKSFTGNGTNLTFSLGINPVSENNTQVFVSGVYKSKSTYSISGSNLVFAAGNAPANAAPVEVVIGVAAELISNVVTIPNSSVGTAAIIDLNVTGAKIADGTITTGKLADQSVTSAKIENNTVGSSKIADLSITTDKLAGGSVTNQKLAPGAVIVSNIGDSAVETIKIADSNVTTAKIADSNVTTAKIADSNITTAKIADLNVTTGKLANLSITTGKLVDQSVTYEKIKDGNIGAVKLNGNQIGLSAIYGIRAFAKVRADGVVLVNKGFSAVSRSSAGVYNLTLTTTPEAVPAIVVTAESSRTDGYNYSAKVRGFSVNNFQVQIGFEDTPGANDVDFSVMMIY